MHRNALFAAAGVALSVLACGDARRIATGEQVRSCARCHGGAESPTGAPIEGAHITHVQALSGERSCVHCHPDPRQGSTAHMDGRVDVLFGALATRNGALPSRYDRGTSSCVAVYCHGAFRGGNEGNAPVWTSVGRGQGDCGTCHALPPALTHAAMSSDLTSCARCHDRTVDAQGKAIAAGAHLNGTVDAREDVCALCHTDVGSGAGMRSSHLVDTTNPSSVCRSCHDPSPEGHYGRPAPDTPCLGCHGGQGEALDGRTPPLLVGWTDTRSGDFHGVRSGTGFGGTLRAPYVRGQAPLACAACHDEHSSTNAFLFASTVNGTGLPAGTIDRAGVGAEALCDACHEGERHVACTASGCHASDPRPAGSACFWCHGHEGILQWPAPDASNHESGDPNGCVHCHGFGQPPVEYVPPRIAQGLTVSGVTATSATFRWGTDEVATSYVEYGVGVPSWIAGDAAFVRPHTVTVLGLEPSTTYVWRVRSADVFRNVGESGLQAFTTPGAEDVPRPDVAPVSAGTTVPNTTAVATILWYPVTAPSGTAVEYEVQLASDPGFTWLIDADLGRADDTLATGNSGWIMGTPANDSSYPPRPALGFDVTLTNLAQDDCVSPIDPNVYFFRVRARDQAGRVSEWSATGSFTAMAGDPWC